MKQEVEQEVGHGTGLSGFTFAGKGRCEVGSKETQEWRTSHAVTSRTEHMAKVMVIDGGSGG